MKRAKRPLPPRTPIEQLLRESKAAYYEIDQLDVGRPLTAPDGDMPGLVLQIDVGKRCVIRAGIFQIENTEQRDARKPWLKIFQADV